MSADNTAGTTIAVVLGGTAVPLPNDHVLDGFTVNAANTEFTVPATGTYLVTYDVRTTAALLLSSRVTRNGAAIPGTVVSPAVALSAFSATYITPLTAGDVLQLQLYGLVGAAVLQTGSGASLTVVRLA